MLAVLAAAGKNAGMHSQAALAELHGDRHWSHCALGPLTAMLTALLWLPLQGTACAVQGRLWRLQDTAPQGQQCKGASWVRQEH